MSYALITGASKGIGKAIATILAQQNTNLLLVARSSDLLKQVAEELAGAYKVKVHYLALDLSSDNAPTLLYDWCTKQNFEVHILVNNAGYGLAGKFEKYTSQQYRDMMTVNMDTPVQLVHKFLPMLKKQSQSYILNIVSTVAYQALPMLTVYSASKVFMLSFSRALQYELRKSNVSVTALSPGATDTDFVTRAEMGPKALKNANKFNMTPDAVAKIAVDSMFKKKIEVITGFTNKLGAFMAWLLPKRFIEGTAAGFYD